MHNYVQCDYGNRVNIEDNGSLICMCVDIVGMVQCACRNPGEDKLLLGCADGTLVSLLLQAFNCLQQQLLIY